MKITILFLCVVLSGCANMTPEQRAGWNTLGMQVAQAGATAALNAAIAQGKLAPGEGKAVLK